MELILAVIDLSECYFAGKGAALVLPPHERLRPSRRVSAAGSDIQQHLQSMFYLLRTEETLKMAVKLESAHAARTRYLVVVSCIGRQDAEESCLLGIDCNERTTVGLVLRVLADTAITLDGDGGFSVSVCGRQHIFKPVSVQAMWSALQTLHKVSSKAREQNYFLGGLTHDWVSYYEQRIESDRSCLNEWHAMDSLESRRPPSPDSVRNKPRERDETERVIRATLKEIMMSVDLDEVTSKYIRSRLEEDLDMDLGEFKPFIDQEMLTILGQMDAPTEIFDHVYLGSEWNASNLEELQKNGVRHILNVTREIDNFFPGMFDYLNIRVYDDEKTDLLKHWDNTFKYITRAKKEGSKVLVHCKMGVSRSASVVIAYAMKAYNWDFDKAMKHVKDKRNCIKPNSSFLAQLETYQGILDAMKNREKLQRSKSETNLKSPGLTAKSERIIPGSEPTPMIQALHRSTVLQATISGQDLRQIGGRPKSWSPDNRLAPHLAPQVAPTSVSLEHLHTDSSKVTFTAVVCEKTSPTPLSNITPPATEVENRNVLMPCENGQVYSVSQNQIFHLPGSCKKSSEPNDSTIASVKHRIIELESQTHTIKNGLRNQPDKKGLVLNLTSQFENSSSKPSSPLTDDDELSTGETTPCNSDVDKPQAKLIPQMLTAVLVKKEIWDPGETEVTTISYSDGVNSVSYKSCDLSCSPEIDTQNGENLVWTSSSRLIETSCSDNPETVESNIDFVNKANVESITNNKTCVSSIRAMPVMRRDGDVFSNQLDRVFDREERKQQRQSTVVTSGPTLPQSGTELPTEGALRDCPSRQSSWSSYDSAVVLGYQGETRDAPSRHSSWGSGDARTLPSRNSSWGSYDMRPVSQSANVTNDFGERKVQPQIMEDLFGSSSSGMFAYDKDEFPAYPGTVKRTKQKIEENSDSTKRNCSETYSQLENISETCPYHSSDTDKSVVHTSENGQLVEAYNVALIHQTKSSTVCNCFPFNKPNTESHAQTNAVDISMDTKSSEKTGVDPNNRVGMFGPRLSASAPEKFSMPLINNQPVSLSQSVSNLSSYCSGETDNGRVINYSVKQHKLFLESLNHKPRCSPKRSLLVEESNDTENKNKAGIVKNLKREFEAKTCTNHDSNTDDKHKNKVRSLPSSPVSAHVDLKEREASVADVDLEDLSVKKLVGKYEESKGTSEEKNTVQETHSSTKSKESHEGKIHLLNSQYNPGGTKTPSEIQKYAAPITKTSLLVRNLKNGCGLRPPVPTVVKSSVPNMVLASVVTNAANKKQQQHGKTHPLSRLTINKQRHNNPVYNTM